jgi:hypothetical protein
VIAMPPSSVNSAIGAHIRSFASSLHQRCGAAIRRGRSGNWLAVVLAVTTALEGCMTVGPLAQSTLIAAAVFKRLSGKTIYHHFQ